jgi:diguanylate cyclase (GGDEF)-like protein
MTRILIAEDSGPPRLALERTLTNWGYDVISCRDGQCAWEELQKPGAPQLVILDWMMPGYSGPEICRMLRSRQQEPYTYILLLTAKSEKEDLVEGMESGADDYIVKPWEHHELRVRVRAGLRILNLQAELVTAREAIREQAMRDSLTGLWNRRSIYDIQAREQARSTREGLPVGVIMIDIDHFKSINDNYGHLAGDSVLQETARRLLSSVRPYDSVGRYGGEEFLVVLPGCDELSVQGRADGMRQAIADTPMSIGGHALRVTASFGATVFTPVQDVEGNHLVRTADEALYEAKRTGRNRVIFRSSVQLPKLHTFSR